MGVKKLDTGFLAPCAQLFWVSMRQPPQARWQPRCTASADACAYSLEVVVRRNTPFKPADTCVAETRVAVGLWFIGLLAVLRGLMFSSYEDFSAVTQHDEEGQPYARKALHTQKMIVTSSASKKSRQTRRANKAYIVRHKKNGSIMAIVACTQINQQTFPPIQSHSYVSGTAINAR